MATEHFAFTDRAIRIIAEDKIQSAIRAGEFDNLPGLGEPFDWCDEPYDPHWWVQRKLKDEKLAAARVHEWTLIREGKDVVDGMVEYQKQFVDRDAIRENLKLSVAERIAKAQDEASRVELDDETESRRAYRRVPEDCGARGSARGNREAVENCRTTIAGTRMNGVWPRFPLAFRPLPGRI